MKSTNVANMIGDGSRRPTRTQKQPPAPAPVGRMMWADLQYTCTAKFIEAHKAKKHAVVTDGWGNPVQPTPVLVIDLSDEARVVECMARAACKADGLNFDHEDDPMKNGGGYTNGKDIWRDQARAVLAALKGETKK